MKISELQKLLEKAKEEYGDVEIEIENEARRECYDIISYCLGERYRRYAGGFIPTILVS